MKGITKTSKSYKALSIVLAVLFLALVLVATTFCWVSLNRDVDTNGMGVVVDPASGILLENLKILKREGADKAKDVSDQKSISLTEYDAMFTDKNVNTPIIMRAVITNFPKDDLDNYMDFCFLAYWLKLGPWKELDDKGNELLTEYLSNIIEVRCSIGNDQMNALTDYDEIYQKGIEYLKNSAEHTFVHMNGKALESKDDIIKFSFNKETYPSAIRDDELVLFIEINYNETLINAYIEQHSLEIGEDVEEDKKLFVCDLTSFVFKDGML